MDGIDSNVVINGRVVSTQFIKSINSILSARESNVTEQENTPDYNKIKLCIDILSSQGKDEKLVIDNQNPRDAEFIELMQGLGIDIKSGQDDIIQVLYIYLSLTEEVLTKYFSNYSTPLLLEEISSLEEQEKSVICELLKDRVIKEYKGVTRDDIFNRSLTLTKLYEGSGSSDQFHSLVPNFFDQCKIIKQISLSSQPIETVDVLIKKVQEVLNTDREGIQKLDSHGYSINSGDQPTLLGLVEGYNDSDSDY